MKKWCVTLALFLALLPNLQMEAHAATHKIGLVSNTAVLMDADTGEILYSKGRNKKMYPASITKILTGLLVVENCDKEEIATVSASAAASNLPGGYVHIALAEGNTISVNDAMYATMLASANDAAHVLGEHVGGSQKKFAKMMNERAAEIGAVNSRFENASGVPSNNHYTTAYDMALITREAIQNKRFMKYFGRSTSYKLPATNVHASGTVIRNGQYMMQKSRSEYNPSVIGAKIGYTGQARYTMVTVAEQDGRTLICVVMGSTRNGRYQDTEAMLQYGFKG